MEYKNDYKECGLMVNENNPNKRNVNNLIKFNLKDEFSLNVGDVIKHGLGSGNCSCYEITEIISIRPSSLSGFNYCECKTKWYLS